MAKPKWIRGLVRLWLVLSVLWVIGSGCLIIPNQVKTWPMVPSVNTIAQALQSGLAHPSSGDLASLTSRDDPVIFFQPEVIYLDDLLSPINSKVHHDIKTWEVSVYVSQSEAPFEITDVPGDVKPELVRKIISHHFMRQWLMVAIDDALIMFVPPMLLLIIGLLARWVIIGFQTAGR